MSAAVRIPDPDDTLSLLRRLIEIPSVNPSLDPDGAGEADIAAETAEWLEAWGFEVDVRDAAPGRPNVLARLRRGPGPRLVLNGHLDTVGVAGMTTEPFTAKVQDGRCRGRGACDMKGGVAALLSAAGRTARRDRFRGELVVALVADEEHASIGLQSLVEDGLAADAAIVCEPTNLAIMPAHKGFVWMEVRFEGRAAHGSRPERGVDAIRHAGLFLARLDDLGSALSTRASHPLLGAGSIHAGTIAGGTAPSVYPDECRLVLERRTLPGENDEEVMAEVEQVLEGVRSEHPDIAATVQLLLSQPGTEVDQDHVLIRSLCTALEETGLEAVVAGMTAWVDAALLNEAGIPAVCFGPGDIEQAHSADEWIEVDQLDRSRDVLERLLHHFPG